MALVKSKIDKLEKILGYEVNSVDHLKQTGRGLVRSAVEYDHHCSRPSGEDVSEHVFECTLTFALNF